MPYFALREMPHVSSAAVSSSLRQFPCSTVVFPRDGILNQLNKMKNMQNFCVIILGLLVKRCRCVPAHTEMALLLKLARQTLLGSLDSHQCLGQSRGWLCGML